MSKRFLVDNAVTNEGKYRVLQEDSDTKERFGIKDFDTKEEAQSNADIMQEASDKASSEQPTEQLPDIEDTLDTSEFKDTLQDLKPETSQE